MTKSLEYIACPLCESKDHKVLFSRKDYVHLVSDENFNVVRCRKCGFVFLNPRPDIKGIHEYYTPEFYSVHLTPEQLLEETRRRNAAKLKMLSHLPPGRLLDIGCQKGEFLYEASKIGWDVFGLEFSQKPPNLFRLPLFHGNIEQAPYEDHSFDLVTMWAVLEHVHDPLSMLRHIRRLLKPTGRALVLVPNFNSIPARLMRHDDVPRHLVMFTPRTFQRMAESAGMNTVRTVFSDDIFSGSTRGSLNFIFKRMCGERIDDIVAQNRSPERWAEFSNHLNGRKSDFMLKVDRFDIRISPYLDRLVNWLGFGFIMTIELKPI